jgi:hypothetical protein
MHEAAPNESMVTGAVESPATKLPSALSATEACPTLIRNGSPKQMIQDAVKDAGRFCLKL